MTEKKATVPYLSYNDVVQNLVKRKMSSEEQNRRYVNIDPLIQVPFSQDDKWRIHNSHTIFTVYKIEDKLFDYYCKYGKKRMTYRNGSPSFELLLMIGARKYRTRQVVEPILKKLLEAGWNPLIHVKNTREYELKIEEIISKHH